MGLEQLKNEEGRIVKLNGKIVVPKLQWGPYIAETAWESFEKIDPRKPVPEKFLKFLLDGGGYGGYRWICPNPIGPTVKKEMRAGGEVKVVTRDLMEAYLKTHMPWTLNSKANAFLIGELDNRYFWELAYNDKYESVERYIEYLGGSEGGYHIQGRSELIGHIPIMYYCI